jgi:hypothetical protein
MDLVKTANFREGFRVSIVVSQGGGGGGGGGEGKEENEEKEEKEVEKKNKKKTCKCENYNSWGERNKKQEENRVTENLLL